MKRSRKDILLALLELQQVSAASVPRAEVHALQREWRRVFAHRVKTLTGKDVYLGFDWHAFGYSLVYSLAGDEARSAFRAGVCESFYVLPHMDEYGGYRCHASTLPQFDRKNIDAYICPFDFGWTMVYTHEGDAFGPYFTRAEWAGRETRPQMNSDSWST